ncbi:MAG: branched-chain amino acid ABC transporter substrate-binding protein [Candidatus Omnitrophica bacterium]|nr:branched-chain amino acid ABC transporter substrate-binding protein [Candidatus Omnitrophota bacterium]
MNRLTIKNLSVLVFILFFAGCADQGANNTVIKIGCAGPLTGDQAQLGAGVCQGVRLAIDQANERGEVIPGYKLEVLSQDDQHNPAQAVNVAKKFVADEDVMVVIGHFNSSCTKPASAIYHEARLTQLTASSTNPDISKQGFDTFFRISATDDVQGPKGARYAANVLKAKNIFIIDDKTTYGKGLADEFKKEAVKIGMNVLGHQGITQGDKDFTPLLTRIKPLAVDLIFFGGIYPEGALLLRQARSLNMPVTFMAGDGLATPTLVELASAPIAEGTYATMVGKDMKKVPGAEAFISAYEAKYGEMGQWSAYGYDAANLLIAVIAKAGKKDREAVLKAMREVPKFEGITGEVVFDEKGDNKNQFIGIFRFESGKLVYIGPAE